MKQGLEALGLTTVGFKRKGNRTVRRRTVATRIRKLKIELNVSKDKSQCTYFVASCASYKQRQ